MSSSISEVRFASRSRAAGNHLWVRSIRFGKEWASQTYGDAAATTFLKGVVVGKPTLHTWVLETTLPSGERRRFKLTRYWLSKEKGVSGVYWNSPPPDANGRVCPPIGVPKSQNGRAPPSSQLNTQSSPESKTVDIPHASSQSDTSKTTLGPDSPITWTEVKPSYDEKPATSALEANCYPGKPKNLDESADYTALDFWNLFLPQKLWNGIVKLTNRQLRASKPGPAVSYRSMMTFIALCLGKSLHPLPPSAGPRAYWFSKSAGAFTNPDFGRFMGYKRFESIRTQLRLNTSIPGDDLLHSIRPLYDHINLTFPKYYELGANCGVDDVALYGRYRTTDVKHSPANHGFKLYALAEAKSGYIMQLSLASSRTAEHGDGVLKRFMPLIKPVAGRKRFLFADHRFGSVGTARDLRQQGVFMTTTVSSSGWKGSATGMAVADDGLVACSWNGGQVVSTIEDTTLSLAKTRKGSYEPKTCVPKVVSLYREYSGGVRKSNQLRVGCQIAPHVTTNTSSQLLFYGLIDIVLTNAFIIARHLRRYDTKFAFLHDLQAELLELGSRETPRKRGRPEEKHALANYSPGVCAWCSMQSKAGKPARGGRTTKFCTHSQCRVRLHAGDCHKDFHTAPPEVRNSIPKRCKRILASIVPDAKYGQKYG